MNRISGAIQAVLEAVAVASDLPSAAIGPDDDLVDDLHLDELELESLQLILEELFAIEVPDEIWNTPLYRTAGGLAEWVVRHSESASYAEAQRQRRSV